MPTTPLLGIPYPEEGDHTRTWEHWQALAEAAEDRLQPHNLRVYSASTAIPGGSVVTTVATPSVTTRWPSSQWTYDTPNLRWQVPVSGNYLLIAEAVWSGAPEASRMVQIDVDGTPRSYASYTGGYSHAISTWPITAGSYARVRVSTITGTNVTVMMLLLRMSPL